MDLVSTQPLTEMSTRNLPGGKERPASKADNLTAICELFHNPVVLLLRACMMRALLNNGRCLQSHC
jgi:hypothetical protein